MATLNGQEGTYKFHRKYSSWRITFYTEDIHNPMYCTHIADFREFEDALRETYRLNGWGEPKKIIRKY